MNKQIIREIEEIIDKLADLSQRDHELERSQRNIYGQMSLIDAETVIDISKARDENGKPVFSNQKLREAERTIRLSQNEDYQSLRSEADEIYDKMYSIRIERTRLLGRRDLLTFELGLLPPEGNF